MKRLSVVVVVAALALLLPGSAAAKGPSEAKITGPGLSSALTIKGVGEGDTSTDLGVLVQDAGFFPEVFGQTPSPLMSAQPSQLGARYLVTYTMPGGAAPAPLEQDLYPYATGGPVSYMRPGQTFWDGQKTVGGWYQGTGRLKAMLMKAGLPSSAPANRDLIALVMRAILRHLL